MELAKIKTGKTVTVAPPRGEKYTGKVIAIDNTARGAWITVEQKIGTGKTAKVVSRKVRAGNLS